MGAFDGGPDLVASGWTDSTRVPARHLQTLVNVTLPLLILVTPRNPQTPNRVRMA